MGANWKATNLQWSDKLCELHCLLKVGSNRDITTVHLRGLLITERVKAFTFKEFNCIAIAMLEWQTFRLFLGGEGSQGYCYTKPSLHSFFTLPKSPSYKRRQQRKYRGDHLLCGGWTHSFWQESEQHFISPKKSESKLHSSSVSFPQSSTGRGIGQMPSFKPSKNK